MIIHANAIFQNFDILIYHKLKKLELISLIFNF